MIPGSANPLLLATAAAGGYSISRSVRFNSSDSAYLSRTPASAGNRKTWSWAGWVKRSAVGVDQSLFSAYTGTASDEAYTDFRFASDDTLRFGGWYTGWRNTTQIFRDASAWYHIVLSVDIGNPAENDRIRVYLNGAQITAFATANNPATTSQLAVNSASAHNIGANVYYTNTTNKFSGYLADIHFIDGQALDPTSFGEFDDNGIWQPKAYSGTYGTNGFHLDFADNSTTAALGTDTAGSNDWTVNNLSVTAGAGNDSLVDVPTNGTQTDTGLGNQVRGNYCTWNPLQLGANITLSNGNLDGSQPSGSGTNTGVTGTIGLSSSKWYWEVTVNTRSGGTDTVIGIASSAYTPSTAPTTTASSWGYLGSALRGNNASFVSYGATYGAGDVIGVALDADAGTLTFYKNGVSQGQAYSGLTSGPYFPLAGKNEGGCSWTWSTNFGQRPFAYTAPSGFKPLNTASLPSPLVTKPSTVMDVKLYTGNGSTQTISGLGFSPDLVWAKCRSVAYGHRVFDAVRGAANALYTNTTQPENDDTNQTFSSFNSDGFSIGTGVGLNANNETYVAWAWDAGSSTVTNTQGSISSQVRANASAGFSVATLTTPGSGTFTVGHGLNVAPSLVICKARNQTFTWIVYHRSAGAGNYLVLNTTAASAASATVWQNTNPSSTLVYGDVTNWGTANYVMYSFAPVAGYSSFGSYTGNGSTDGPFVYCGTGFRPAFVLIKATGAVGGNWMIYDNRRAPSNLNNKKLAANTALQENETANLGDDSLGIDFLSNGFKIRQTGGNHNNSGTQYIYAAFAESPFQFSRAR
jgi:hypothetical protein